MFSHTPVYFLKRVLSTHSDIGMRSWMSLLGVLGAMGPNFIFVDKNEWPYNTHIVDEFHDVAYIRSIYWPSRSSDHNSIEYVLDGLEETISQLSSPPRTFPLRRSKSPAFGRMDLVATDTY
ncbi:hypothetical protein TNCV_2682831 [Trichonephila clavipes]|nr:hypothetical protein TNCV_2682831 [Trichonephila clavipes]